MALQPRARRPGHLPEELLEVQARSLRCIQYGDTEVELSAVEQLVEISQEMKDRSTFRR